MILDTHTFIWFIEGDDQLSRDARMLIEDTSRQRFLSIASGWEMAIKINKGLLILSSPLDDLLTVHCEENDISVLPITVEHILRVRMLPPVVPSGHKDPFDRLIIAQAMVEGMPIVSADGKFDQYDVTRLW